MEDLVQGDQASSFIHFFSTEGHFPICRTNAHTLSTEAEKPKTPKYTQRQDTFLEGMGIKSIDNCLKAGLSP